MCIKYASFNNNTVVFNNTIYRHYPSHHRSVVVRRRVSHLCKCVPTTTASSQIAYKIRYTSVNKTKGITAQQRARLHNQQCLRFRSAHAICVTTRKSITFKTTDKTRDKTASIRRRWQIMLRAVSQII